MPEITGSYTDNHGPVREQRKQQGKHGKGKKYRKKYAAAEKRYAKQKTKNKLVRQEMKYKEMIHAEREARSRAEGKADAYREIIEKFMGSKYTLDLPESVIEVNGEVRDA